MDLDMFIKMGRILMYIIISLEYQLSKNINNLLIYHMWLELLFKKIRIKVI